MNSLRRESQRSPKDNISTAQGIDVRCVIENPESNQRYLKLFAGETQAEKLSLAQRRKGRQGSENSLRAWRLGAATFFLTTLGSKNVRDKFFPFESVRIQNHRIKKLRGFAYDL